MNVSAKGRKPNNRQLIIFGLMALAVVYHFSRPTLEKWFNTSLPSVTQDDDRQVNNSVTNSSGSSDYEYNAKLPNAKAPAKQSQGSSTQSGGSSEANPGKAARNWLKDIGRNNYKSPAGLIYGGGREHRIDHVLLHCKDNPSKPTHGIFVGNAVEVMQMIDEAYDKVKSRASGVNSQKSGDKMTHTVSMGRVVGHTGGKKAKRQGRKELRKVKIVLADDRVITAFPTH